MTYSLSVFLSYVKQPTADTSYVIRFEHKCSRYASMSDNHLGNKLTVTKHQRLYIYDCITYIYMVYRQY